jgi:hypothetical protein
MPGRRGPESTCESAVGGLYDPTVIHILSGAFAFMLNRRIAGVVAALLLLPLAACAGPGKPAAEAGKPFDPQATLAASTSGIDAGNYRLNLTMPGDGHFGGTVHTPSKSADITMKMKQKGTTLSMQFRFLDSQQFTKFQMDEADLAKMRKQLDEIAAMGDVGGAQMRKATKSLSEMLAMFSGKKWVKIDKTKLRDKSEATLDIDDPDLAGVSTLVKSATTAQGDKNTITGTLDATKVATDDAFLGNDTFSEVPADVAKAVPYTATLDAEGRLTKLVLDLPKFSDYPAGKWVTELGEYGTAKAAQAPPAAEVKEAGPEVYEMLNG